MKHKNRMHHGLKNKSERFREKFRSLCKPINFLDQQRSTNTLRIGCFFPTPHQACAGQHKISRNANFKNFLQKCSLETCGMSCSFHLLSLKQKLALLHMPLTIVIQCNHKIAQHSPHLRKKGSTRQQPNTKLHSHHKWTRVQYCSMEKNISPKQYQVV